MADPGVAPPAADGETVFSCPGHHGAPQNVMTYVYRVYDSDGQLADCLAQGHDPEIVIDDLMDRRSDPSRPNELTDCRQEFGVY